MRIKNYQLFTESLNEKTFIAEFEDEKGKKSTKEFKGEKLEDVTIEATNYAEDNDLELLGIEEKDEKVEESKIYEKIDNLPYNAYRYIGTFEYENGNQFHTFLYGSTMHDIKMEAKIIEREEKCKLVSYEYDTSSDEMRSED